jgi:hypothetical protein
VGTDKIRFGKYGIVFFFSFGVPKKHSGIACGPMESPTRSASGMSGIPSPVTPH